MSTAKMANQCYWSLRPKAVHKALQPDGRVYENTCWVDETETNIVNAGKRSRGMLERYWKDPLRLLRLYYHASLPSTDLAAAEDMLFSLAA